MIPIQFELPKWLTRTYFEVKPLEPKAKTAFVVGHNRINKGAYSPHLKMYEFDYWSEVVKGLTINVDILKHDVIGLGYTQRQKLMAKRTKDYDLVIELHFNAASPQANGCEILYYFNNKDSKLIGQNISKEVHNYFNIKIRGDKGVKALLSKLDRGFGFVYYQSPRALIFEPFFGSSKKDCAKISIEKMTDFLNQSFF